MRSRIFMALTVLLFGVCIARGTDDISGELPENVVGTNVSYEEIKPNKDQSEEQKRESLNNYLTNMFAKDIMTCRGVLGCKVNLDIYNESASENSITVQYFYDSEVIDDAVGFEDTLRQFMLASVPEVENVYLRGTSVTNQNADEFAVDADDSPIKNLPIDIGSNLNFIPVVPN